MDIVTGVMLVFSVIGGVDRILGNRFGLGAEFEKGFMLLGSLALTMIGMIAISPVLAELMEPFLMWLNEATGLEPAMLTSLIFANDMGGGALAREIAVDAQLGRFGGMVVAAMLGCTISFTIPYALGVVPEEKREWLLLGLMCGIIAIPVGCFLGGVASGLNIRALLFNMLPLIVISGLLAAGIMLCPKVCTRIFGLLGRGLQIVITIGLVLAIIRFLSGYELVKGMDTLENGAGICVSAAVIMTGAFPLLAIIAWLLRKPLRILGDRLRLNEASTLGFIATLANSITTFDSMRDMDGRGVMLNSAFAVSAAFALGDHLAFTLAFDGGMLPGMLVGKLAAGALGVALANIIYKRKFV